MSQRFQSKRLLTAICLITLSLTLSGCVYLRLLYFKNQLKKFDQNVTVQSSQKLVFGFRDPIVRDADFVFLSGASPEDIEKLHQGHRGEVWTWTFNKKLGSPDDQPFSMAFKTRFKDRLLTHMEIDETFVKLIGSDPILSMFKNIGEAKINKLKRSMSIELDKTSVLTASLPSLNEIFDVMGRPSRIAKPQSNSGARCEYEFNFHDPESGKKAGQFQLHFTGSLQNPNRSITGFTVTGKAR